MSDMLSEKEKDQSSEIKSLRETVERKDLEITTLRETIEYLQRTVPETLKALLDRPVEELPEEQRAVLQEILALPDNAFAEAENLIESLKAPPMTQKFCKTLQGILKQKNWAASAQLAMSHQCPFGIKMNTTNKEVT